MCPGSAVLMPERRELAEAETREEEINRALARAYRLLIAAAEQAESEKSSELVQKGRGKE